MTTPKTKEVEKKVNNTVDFNLEDYLTLDELNKKEVVVTAEKIEGIIDKEVFVRGFRFKDIAETKETSAKAITFLDVVVNESQEKETVLTTSKVLRELFEKIKIGIDEGKVLPLETKPLKVIFFKENKTWLYKGW